MAVKRNLKNYIYLPFHKIIVIFFSNDYNINSRTKTGILTILHIHFVRSIKKTGCKFFYLIVSEETKKRKKVFFFCFKYFIACYKKIYMKTFI